VFVDTAMRVVQWNHGAERLTGITAESICHKPWSTALLKMRNEKAQPIAEDDCPIGVALRSGVQSLRRLSIAGRGGRTVSVDSHAIPVLAADGARLGAVLLMHDASPEASLEERCHSLHDKATKDPLTQVANRAEFDRVEAMFIEAHRQQNAACALMMCDLDLFKQVNDVFGHQAGDDVIRTLAALLQNSARPGDLVARYGGEEFVVLCAGCDNATAARRADEIRKALAQIPQIKMGGRAVTVSFGVTEIQAGDTPETMLRRADRALLMAKQQGRNTVVQLGVGAGEERTPDKSTWFWPFRSTQPPMVFEQDLITPVPVAIAIEKLRGFVTDHCAKILEVNGNTVQLEIDQVTRSQRRRAADRAMAFRMRIELSEEHCESEDQAGVAFSRTRLHLVISPVKNRDRRRDDVAQRASQLMSSFRSYLIATVVGEPASEGVLKSATRRLLPWLAKP
jgi:diguanylate cyclase (GGDEF)-like protein